MTINTEKLLQVFRAGVVACSLLALLVCGRSAIGHQVAVAQPSVEETPDSENGRLVEQAGEEVDEATRQMDTGKTGRTGTAAYYMSGVLAKTGNDDSRFRRGGAITTPHLVRSNNRLANLTAISTSARISSSLGRQFTLVGAKPSGTS